MQEYWVNVYKWNDERYPQYKQDFYVYNNRMKSIKNADHNQILYRIHVKMKELPIKVTVLGNCGKPHTMNEWRMCRACAAPNPINGIFRRDNWME